MSQTAEVAAGGSPTQVDRLFLAKTVGECFSVSVMFSDVVVKCLLDPGSQVTTIGEDYYRKCLAPKGFELRPIPGLFSLVSANGTTIPYIGYFESDIHALGQTIKSRVVLVLREESSPLRTWEKGGIPGILGMNVLEQCWERLVGSDGRQRLEKIPWPHQDGRLSE